MTFWTAQILGLIGSLLAFTAVQTGSRRKIIGLQLVCCVLWVVQYVLLGAWPGVRFNLRGLARGVVCAYNDRPWARSRLWLALFLACYGAAPLLTWDGPYCLLLGAAMMLTTAALWTRNMRLTRLLFLPSGVRLQPDRRLLYRRRHRGGRLLLLRAGRVAL